MNFVNKKQLIKLSILVSLVIFILFSGAVLVARSDSL